MSYPDTQEPYRGEAIGVDLGKVGRESYRDDMGPRTAGQGTLNVKTDRPHPGAFGALADQTSNISANACEMEARFRRAMDRLGLFPESAGPDSMKVSPDQPASLLHGVGLDLQITEHALRNMSGLIEVLERATDR